MHFSDLHQANFEDKKRSKSTENRNWYKVANFHYFAKKIILIVIRNYNWIKNIYSFWKIGEIFVLEIICNFCPCFSTRDINDRKTLPSKCLFHFFGFNFSKKPLYFGIYTVWTGTSFLQALLVHKQKVAILFYTKFR